MKRVIGIIVCMGFWVGVLSAGAEARLIFKMTADKKLSGGGLQTLHAGDSLLTGDECVVRVWALLDDVTDTTKGLIGWQTDVHVDTNNILAITKNSNLNGDITLLQPTPFFVSGWLASSVNSPLSGEVRGVSAATSVTNQSVAVNQYTELFNFSMLALHEGTTGLWLTNDGGGAFGGRTAARQYTGTSVLFDAENSFHTFLVVPEPAGCSLLAVWGLVWIRRRSAHR